MEEILASIRRIIADDQTLPQRAPVPESSVRSDSRDETIPTPFNAMLDGREVEANPVVAAALLQHGPVAAPQFPSLPVSQSSQGIDERAREAAAPTRWAGQAFDLPPFPDEFPATPADAGPSRDPLDAPLGILPSDLFSQNTGQSVSSAFNVLAATRLADNSEELLGLAREMIRPLLKTWLDDNLPSMVERLVRAEIERVARGGR